MPLWPHSSCRPEAIQEDTDYGLVWAGFYSNKHKKGSVINSTTHNIYRIKNKVSNLGEREILSEPEIRNSPMVSHRETFV